MSARPPVADAQAKSPCARRDRGFDLWAGSIVNDEDDPRIQGGAPKSDSIADAVATNVNGVVITSSSATDAGCQQCQMECAGACADTNRLLGAWQYAAKALLEG